MITFCCSSPQRLLRFLLGVEPSVAAVEEGETTADEAIGDCGANKKESFSHCFNRQSILKNKIKKTLRGDSFLSLPESAKRLFVPKGVTFVPTL